LTSLISLLGVFWSKNSISGIQIPDYINIFPMKQVLLNIVPILCLGVYLLINGAFLYRCLMSVPQFWKPSPLADHNQQHSTASLSQQRPKPEEWMGLIGDEISEFKTWLEKHPELKNRDLEDKIALFRDSQ
ncbi:MAG: hypothetical protein AAF226_02925, partial [Verrucomicrobiota bacterium]